MRVYIPLDRDGLERLARSRAIPPGRAYAVTPGLRAAYATDDVEELEYAAMMTAAAASADRDRRRIVVAADVDSVTQADEADVGGVLIEDPVHLTAVAAFHVADDPDDDLAWYATQELDQLVNGG